MARKGKKMYRQLIRHHKEDSGSAGDFNSFAYIEREANVKGGYCDKVTIHYMLEDRVPVSSTDAANLASQLGMGVLFAASLSNATETVDGESGLLDPNDILHIRARSGVAGSVTLPVKHLITQNAADTDEKDGRVYLWMKTPDVTTDDTLLWRFYIEVHGRWLKAYGL